MTRHAAIYYNDSLIHFGKLFEHDDNVPEGQLGSAFERTVALYEKRFPGEPYNPPPTQVRCVINHASSFTPAS